ASKPPRLRARYQYVKLCPQNSLVNGGQFLLPPNKSDVRASVSYNIGECLNDGDVYDSLIYSVQSSRLLAPATGFLKVQFKLPWGLYWDPTCSLVLGGKSPLSTDISTVQGEYTTVDLLYPLPFATDSVFGRFCLKYECDTSVNCVETIPNPPDSGDDFTIFPPGTMCDNCVLISEMTSAIVPTVNTPLECALTACDAFPLTVNNTCGAGGGGGGGGGGGIGGGNLTKLSFKSYRTNLGLKDDDDNREADEPVTITTNPNIRRNRYMVGDTMRTELGAKVVAGTLPELAFRIFNETWFSDMGKFDSDGFIIDAAKPGFVDSLLLNFLGSNLQIFTADGQQKTCPLNGPTIRSDQHLYTITPPNIRPPSPVDIVANMFDQYEVNFEDLAGNCNGYIPKQGDSILISTDYKFMMNFVPLIATSLPPLVNFRTQACGIDNVLAWTLGGCIPTDTMPNQYSGYIEEFTPPVYAIGPCDTTEAKQPAVYMIRIARGNMFPNEVRNLTSIVDYRQNFPQGVPHISSQVDFLNLQENDQKFGLTPLATPTPVSGLQRYNISSFFAKPLDEGYRIQISSKFGKACSYAGNTTLTSQIRVKYKDKCFHDPTDQTYTNSDPNGFQNGSAELNMILSGTVFELPSENFEANFFIRNNTQYIADNAYLWVEANGLLEDIQILQQPSGNPVIQAGGVFQLGNIDPFGQPPFKIVAKSKICDPITVTLHYGWDCDPLAFTQGANTCGSEKKEFIITPIKPELDLNLIVQDTVLSMCDESDYIEFEVFNADDGVAYGVVASVLLPPGMVIVPNSSGLSYPSGVSYTAMGNPVQKPGNVWEWTPNLPNGLAGAEDEPLDRFKIRFRVETQCGFVANSQMFYGTEAVRSCGALSNITRKPGGKLQLEGLTESYNVQANLGFATPPGSVDCAENTELKATIVMGSTPMATDSIYIILPAGISYVAGSYDPDGSAPAGPPQQIGQQLQLPLPGNLGVGQAFTFNFKVQYDDPAGCGDKIIVLQTRERKSVFCPTINANCDVYVATGETFLPLNAQNPNLRLNNFSTSETGGSLNFSAELENIGSGSAFNPNIKIYLDINGNGQVDATDQLVTNYMGNLTLAGGATAIINGTLPNLSADDLCKLLAFVPAMDNCGCEDQTIPLGGMSSVTHAIGKCGVSSVDVGLTNVPGHTYTWLTTNGLSCVDCSMATYTPGINVSNGEVITLVLEDKTPNGCVVQHRYEIKFGGLTTFDIPDQTICEGEYVALAGPPATTYNWTGPGITQANQQTQYLQPTLPVSNYFLTITIVDGATTCTKNISTKVTVLQRDTVTLTPRTTCQGNPVNMYGTVTDEPGIYFGEIQQDNGCIGIEIQELIVLDSAIHETIPLCPGDSVQVLDSLFKAPGVYIENTFINGCPALHYYNVVGVDGLNLPSLDSVIIKLGDDAVLDVPNNLAIYDWDGEPLSCKDCFDPIATPDKTTDYMLFATDGNGCKDTLTYRVLVFPPCDPVNLKIPNAFTPNGDMNNESFSAVKHEGFEKVVSLRIYNRWGQKVWTGGPNEGWDGKIDGKDAPVDVYVWIMIVDCDGEQLERKGEVTLIR
ncbi:MAG: gliding motility-associated C-terminal domain-containing protein, partial [Saprospiraceae bacterium]|nr:gliding motility-associated C-terminal domain-containing protein [Saprospiraceae bacterium]